MKRLLPLILLGIGLTAPMVESVAQTPDFSKHYAGGDISMFPTYQQAGVTYKDENGNKIDYLPYLHDVGMNAMRVRLFVNPDSYTIENGVKKEDVNVIQNLPYIIPLCQDIINNGFDLMLDFHYSDTWADPEKQYIPDAWKNLTDAQLIETIYNYTKNSLETLKENGITPKFIQPGNEISYGMLWAGYGQPDNGSNHAYMNGNKNAWTRFGDLLTSAIAACREVCPQAQIIIHTERVAQVNVLTNFYNMMASLNIDYDIIGLSYYPYFHGTLAQLNYALKSVEAQFPDYPIMIVETGYPLYWQVKGATMEPEFGYGTAEKQDAYTKALVDLLEQHEHVTGLFWWWMEYNPYISNSQSLEDWYNAPLVDPKTGKVLPATKTLASFASNSGSVEWIGDDYSEESKDNRWFNLQGVQINKPSRPGIYIHKGKKVVIGSLGAAE